jgi:cephalosporin hydroxylase
MDDPFEREKHASIQQLGLNDVIKRNAHTWIADVSRLKYSYNFTWLGRPIIQFPQDIVAMQEIIWRIRPDLIIETGVARGGSLILYASLLELIGQGEVLGIDVEIREHNRVEIEKHPLARRISLLEGSSIDESVFVKVREFAQGNETVLVVLDSNHTHEHVARELALYAPLVTKGSYLVVFDTIIEDMPDDFFPDRPWGKGNNPGTAVREFLKATDRFEIDQEYNSKLLISVAPDGYLRCVKD